MLFLQLVQKFRIFVERTIRRKEQLQNIFISNKLKILKQLLLSVTYIKSTDINVSSNNNKWQNDNAKSQESD